MPAVSRTKLLLQNRLKLSTDVRLTLALVLWAHLALSVSARAEKSEHCASCHGMMLEGRNSVPLSGATFQARWADENHSIDDLFYIVRTLMPYGKPASLSKQEYIDIIAYILMINGYPAGAQALPLDPAVLKRIIIRPRRP